MSWMWDWLQQGQIADNRKVTQLTRASVHTADRRLDELEKKLGMLSLLCRALTEELEQRTGLSQDQIKARMLDIDLRDGKEDGKYDPHALLKCPGCGRKIVERRGVCMWCGHALE